MAYKFRIMRILAFSDWRVQSMESLFKTLDRLEEPVDLILYAGDDVSRFQDDERNVFSELASEARLGKVLAVLGNDDLPISDSGSLLGEDQPPSESALEGKNVHNLHYEPFVYEEYVFLGLEGAVEGGPGLILYSEEEIQEHLRQQYAGHEDRIPVLVSHVPPNGILDIGLRFGQRHIGSTSVRSFIEEVEPVLTVCGHCHQFGGRAEEHDFGTVINIASHDDPGAKGRYGVIELDGPELHYELTTTKEGVEHYLLQLSQVGDRRIRHFLDVGITELEDIREDNREILLDLPGVYDWHMDMWLEEAEAIRNDELRIRDEKEFEFLESDSLMLVDIETDLSQDRIWLIGLYSFQDDEFEHIFEKDDEEKLLEIFIQHLQNRSKPNVVYYGNNRFDEKCLKRRMSEHRLHKGVELMENSFDLGIEVHNHLLGEFNRTSLDNLARKIADYEYKYPEMDGFIVGAKYTKYLLDDQEPDWEKLLDYNRDDIMALKNVVNRIREIMQRQSS